MRIFNGIEGHRIMKIALTLAGGLGGYRAPLGILQTKRNQERNIIKSANFQSTRRKFTTTLHLKKLSLDKTAFSLFIEKSFPLLKINMVTDHHCGVNEGRRAD